MTNLELAEKIGLSPSPCARRVKQLEEAGFRCEFHRADNPLGKRIRDVKTQKIPYVLVAGSDDVANGTVGVNPRGSEVERDVPLSDFLERLQSEVENRI